MRTADDIFSRIRDSFATKVGDEPGETLDFYSRAVAEVDGEIYEEIEKNKTPHVWTSLEGQTLDDTGTWVNCPRDPGESDTSYSYRLMKWMLRNEACNETAISVHLLNPQEASDIEFVAQTNGCGTGTCYVIPKEYTEESISSALEEAQQRIKEIASPTTYIDYIIPEMRSVSIEAYISAPNGDLEAIKRQITDQVREYVNTVPPKEYLSLGKINKIGVNTDNVDYFSILSLVVNGEQVNATQVLQQIESKFIFNNISWTGGN